MSFLIRCDACGQDKRSYEVKGVSYGSLGVMLVGDPFACKNHVCNECEARKNRASAAASCRPPIVVDDRGIMALLR